MSRWLLTLVLLMLATATVDMRMAPQLTRVEMDVAAWSHAVGRHTPGTADEHARTIATWPWQQLKPVIAGVAEGEHDPALLLRAAVLYADIAWFVPLDQRPLYPATARAVLAEDGRRTGATWLDSPLAVAQHLVGRALRSEGADDKHRRLAREWFRAITAVLAGKFALADLEPHVTEGLRHFGTDAGILFDAGCLEETFASPGAQAAMRDNTRGRGTAAEVLRSNRYARKFNLENAERYLRRALDADPLMTEARVRLARVMMTRGQPAEAVSQLQRATTDMNVEALVRYYAQLFLGDALTQLGRTREAIEAFTRASALYPNAQSPRLSLSRLTAELGQSGAARKHAAQLLELPPGDEERTDPWWVYDRCSGRSSDRIYADLSARVVQLDSFRQGKEAP